MPVAPDQPLRERWREDLAERLSRPGEVWVLLGMSGDQARSPGSAAVWALDRQRLRLAGAWQGHACQPAVLEQSLDGLVIAQEDGNGLFSWLGAWLDCLRQGGRLLMVSQGQAGAARRAWLRQLYGLSDLGELRLAGATDYRRRGQQILVRPWAQPARWQSRLALTRSPLAQLEFIREGSTPQLAQRLRPAREHVAMPLPGATRV